MSKTITAITIICLLLVFTGLAQTNQKVRFFCSYGEANHGSELCEILQRRSFASNQHAERAVSKILKPLGLKPNFILVSCPETSNAQAVTLDGDEGDGLRYIVYDNTFMEGIDRDSNTNWASVSILAHEIGHHLNGHTTLKQHNPPTTEELQQSRDNELEADEFSGSAMSKLGATLAQAQSAMMALDDITKPEEESTHPKRWKRLAAIKTGYESAHSERAESIRKVACVHRTACEHRVACVHQTACIHQVACGHRMVCAHRVPCTHAVACQHPIQTMYGLRPLHPQGDAAHPFDTLHPFDVAHPFDTLHPFDVAHPFDTLHEYHTLHEYDYEQ